MSLGGTLEKCGVIWFVPVMGTDPTLVKDSLGPQQLNLSQLEQQSFAWLTLCSIQLLNVPLDIYRAGNSFIII